MTATRALRAPRRLLRRGLLACLALAATASTALAQAPAAAPTQAPAARVMLLGLFHFDNPGLDAVKYRPIDVMQPTQQAYLVGLAERLARFAPTKVLLEYPRESDELINQRYADHLAGRFDLRRNEIYQIGFRVARRMGHARVHGFDAEPPAQDVKLWSYLSQEPAAERALMALIDEESRRLQALHDTRSLRDILALSNSAEADRRNKGFYMLLNPVAAGGAFHGADASAHWWHRNLRMYALVQQHAAAGERVLVIAGSGHTAILRDLLRADAARLEEDVLPYF